MKLSCFLLSFYILNSICFGASITIHNDSPYPLIATILSAQGKQLKKVIVNPQQNAEWDDPSPPNAIFSETPYTVIFTCKTGGHFGTYQNVSPGAWVTPSGAAGGQGYCKPEKDKASKMTTKRHNDFFLNSNQK